MVYRLLSTAPCAATVAACDSWCTTRPSRACRAVQIELYINGKLDTRSVDEPSTAVNSAKKFELTKARACFTVSPHLAPLLPCSLLTGPCWQVW